MLNTSDYVNDVFYAAYMVTYSNQNFIAPFPADPYAYGFTAVAEYDLQLGGFYTGLSYDDVGGLAYLLSTNNVNYETLLPGVAGTGTNPNSFVNGARRPGVDKIAFVPQPVDVVSRNFLPVTNHFTDRYLANGLLQQQPLARTISRPDFLFSAGDVKPEVPGILYLDRTGTTNWLNNSAANGNTNGAGPGVIQPPVQIVFNTLGRLHPPNDDSPFDFSKTIWASFDASTNPVVVYPVSRSDTNQMTVRVWLSLPDHIQKSFAWKPSSLSGSQFVLQTSTDLASWTTLFTITNDGSVYNYFPYTPQDTRRFYRLVPQ